MVNLTFGMLEVRTIRQATNLHIIKLWQIKKDLKNDISKGKHSVEVKSLLHKELREVNDQIEKTMALENKIDHAIRNQTGEDM